MQTKIVDCHADLPRMRPRRGFIWIGDSGDIYPATARAYSDEYSARFRTLPADRAGGSVTFNRDEFDIIQQIAPEVRLHSFLNVKEKCTVARDVSS